MLKFWQNVGGGLACHPLHCIQIAVALLQLLYTQALAAGKAGGRFGGLIVSIKGPIQRGTALLDHFVPLPGGQIRYVGRQTPRRAGHAQVLVVELKLVEQGGQGLFDLGDAVYHVLRRQFFRAQFEDKILRFGNRRHVSAG